MILHGALQVLSVRSAVPGIAGPLWARFTPPCFIFLGDSTTCLLHSWLLRMPAIACHIDFMWCWLSCLVAPCPPLPCLFICTPTLLLGDQPHSGCTEFHPRT
jgi:hypothetical protein